MTLGVANNKVIKYFFYKRKRYQKKNCIMFENYLQKKSTIYSHMCFDYNLVNVSYSIKRIIDSSTSMYIANNLQDIL